MFAEVHVNLGQSRGKLDLRQQLVGPRASNAHLGQHLGHLLTAAHLSVTFNVLKIRTHLCASGFQGDSCSIKWRQRS
jgi:hypothetical protein